QMAERGWPLTFRRLRDVINRFLCSKYGPQFEGVGQRYVYRFVAEHDESLKSYWTRPIDTQRGQAVNPHTHEAWMKLLGETIQRFDIEPECEYAGDETGFNPVALQRTKGIGKPGKKTQYQQNNGTRETITALAIICADGTCLPPVAIFKGDAFQIAWKENDPLNAT
ncbi:hypothetical protein K488DRAFT_56172, partial [Vararia minispora EC-137]